jgi:uncharacterized damage-inducible protein DinB
MDARVAAEAIRQVLEGRDFPPPRQILSNVKPEQAAALPPGFKYSLLTLVEHTWFWQEIWLARLTDRKRPDMKRDWRLPDVEEWPEVRQRFLDGLEEAYAIASAGPFVHRMKTDEAAIEALLQIAVHDAYHVGQFVLLKRAMRGMER